MDEQRRAERRKLVLRRALDQRGSLKAFKEGVAAQVSESKLNFTEKTMIALTHHSDATFIDCKRHLDADTNIVDPEPIKMRLKHVCYVGMPGAMQRVAMIQCASVLHGDLAELYAVVETYTLNAKGKRVVNHVRDPIFTGPDPPKHLLSWQVPPDCRTYTAWLEKVYNKGQQKPKLQSGAAIGKSRPEDVQGAKSL